MRVLVTGADGFVGQHVLAALLERGHHAVGGIRGPEPDLDTLPDDSADRVEWTTFELRDAASVRHLVGATQPDALLHLAGLTSVAASWEDPEATFHVNAHGTLHLLQALREMEPGPDPRPVVLVGSAEAYGRNGTEDAPLTEDVPLRPLNPYAASKAAQEMLAWAMGRTDHTRLVQTRSFVQTGPGQSPTFVTVDWASQLLDARDRGRAPVLRVGNIDVVRDFLDVRDAVDAYLTLLEDPDAHGVFNVCSGHGIPLRSLLQRLQTAVGVDATVEVDPDRLRPAEISSLVGDPGRLMAATGWRPRRPFDRTLGDLIAHLERSRNPD